MERQRNPGPSIGASAMLARVSLRVIRLLSGQDFKALLCEMAVERESPANTQAAHKLKARTVDQAQPTTACEE